MDIEHLTKSQIVLLTLLVSFVTSIATGIVTVSLMEQAPPIVAQTVNRVIEHTIQTIATSSPSGQSAATVVSQEKTVIVNQSDEVVRALQHAEPSVVRIFSSDEVPVFLALGVVVDASGTVVTDLSALTEGAGVVIVRSDSSRVHGNITSRTGRGGFAKITPVASTTATVAWVPAGGPTGQTLLGESVIALAGKAVSRVGKGIVTSIANGADTPSIETDISIDSIVPGSPLMNTDGDIVGLSTGESRAIGKQDFIPSSLFFP